MIGLHHAATQFASKVRIILIPFAHLSHLIAKLLRSNGSTRTKRFEVERLVIVAVCLAQRTVPEAIGIVAIKRQHLTKKHRCGQLRPTRTGIERQVEANLLGDTFQVHQILATSSVFIVKLSRDDRTAILPLQTLHLRKNLAIEFLHITQEHRIPVSHATALGEHPIRNPAIAHLPMTERPQSQHHRHILVPAYFQEATQVSLTVPTEDTLFLLHVVPEHIGGNHRHPTLFHLAHLLLPFVGRDTRIVHLAHHRHDATSIHHQTMFVPCHERMHGLVHLVGDLLHTFYGRMSSHLVDAFQLNTFHAIVLADEF